MAINSNIRRSRDLKLSSLRRGIFYPFTYADNITNISKQADKKKQSLTVPISNFTRVITAPNLSVIRSNTGVQFATKHLVVVE